MNNLTDWDNSISKKVLIFAENSCIIFTNSGAPPPLRGDLKKRYASTNKRGLKKAVLLYRKVRVKKRRCAIASPFLFV